MIADADPPVEVPRPHAQARSTRSTQQAAASTGPELPFTGSGTPMLLASGLAALAMGALALWWGSRKRPELDAAEPEATG